MPAALRPLEQRLHQACLESTLAAGRAAGCRLEVSSPLDLALPADVHRRPQQGPDFGSRLERAAGEALADHGGTLVLVGSDVPDLAARHLRRTLKALEEDPERVVIGPSPDGGFYLLATARPLGTALSAVRWRCSETLRSLKRALREQGRPVVLLPTLADLDRRSDLEHWLASTARRTGAVLWRRLVVHLGQALAELRRSRLAEIVARPHQTVLRVSPLRGPPLLALSP